MSGSGKGLRFDSRGDVINPGFRRGLVDTETHLRQATREQGLLTLGMSRIDVRCSALESISTQATLVAGFAFGSLAPDVLDTLTGEGTPFDVAFASAVMVCTGVAFAASIWVIYMALYVGYKAQFTALQGKSGRAVSVSLAILLKTNDRISMFFNASLVALALGATLISWVHLHPVAFLSLLASFSFFVYDGLRFRTELDEDFVTVTNPPAIESKWSTEADKRGVHFELGGGTSERDSNQSVAEVHIEGWLFKSKSSAGPNAKPLKAPPELPQTRRYFVLQGHRLRWYRSRDEAMLQQLARSDVDMRTYAVQIVDMGARLLALTPRADAPSNSDKSWYLRTSDAEETADWFDALTAAAAIPRAEADPASEAATANAAPAASTPPLSSRPVSAPPAGAAQVML